MSILAIQDLHKTYGARPAVQGVNMKIGSGQIYGFLGPNGAGKTTTIRMLLGLIRPSRGNIQLFEQHLNRRALTKVGAIVEAPSAYGHLTGKENLQVVARLRGMSERRIPELLDYVGLKDAQNRVVRGYSLGMKGRLSIAAALMGSPEFLVLDEPTNGLDPNGIREVRELIQSLPQRGITVMVSSHILSEVEQMATHVGIIHQGMMRYEGALKDLQNRSKPTLRIRVSDPEVAFSKLQMSYPQAQLSEKTIELPADPEKAPGIIRELVQQNFDVYSITPHQATLEDLFMNITSKERAQ
ncbi:ABC transporter ATP-binding protein [Deinococcus cellulosilyticus]|uniref:ABC transporter ATP-binding protein n=1 Tax=Deinococcus cellulosilyticus (strain DSM 18568 / NBRC 106333 / KACC 11606 / 5516J-15) TaxID=1223518 RepID=A0A511N4Q4_DEIC1|nr:ABC transporter ATP-binding protein [Deinococcus cellulosilyticus]GEM47805.1 ABC transporter ATP-binding protein [Deinococcus cellulosilyticus NBRC 106333 = KACC 11606]